MVENEITKEHIEKRVNDWKTRILDLYKEVDQWLSSSEYSIKSGNSISMYEELMQKFNVPADTMDTADIYKKDKIILSIKPKGLWIIGANGRIDILTSKGSYTLVDFSDQFKKPVWHIYSSKDIQKKNGKVFNKEELLNILNS